MEPKRWQEFLRYTADAYELLGKRKEVFLTRFAYINWRKRGEEVVELANLPSLQTYKKHLTEIYKQFSSDKPDGCPSLNSGSERPGRFEILLGWLRDVKHPEWLSNFRFEPSVVNLKAFDPECSLPIDSRFYVERPPLEENCYHKILQPGALIRLKAARRMGKTSLLSKIFAYAGCQGYRQVRINFFHVEQEKFSSLDKFLCWFCTCIGDELHTASKADNFWNQSRSLIDSCTTYFETLLKQENSPLVLGLDGLDRVFQYPDITQDFFYMLRNWHEEANNREIWENLRLILVYSTEDYGSLDIDKSPFNVGTPTKIEEFNQKQVEDLVHRHQLLWGECEVQQLVSIVGGHPYLVQLTLSYFASYPRTSLDEFIKSAATEDGIFVGHLHPLLVDLEKRPALSAVFARILTEPELSQIEVTQGYKLYSMGLIKWSGNQAVPRCELYRRYFTRRLRTEF